MKKIAIVAVATLALACTACTTVEPVGASGANIGSKVGEATTTYLFGYLPFPFDQSDNGGVKAAAKNGGITKVATVDVKTYNLLNLIVKKTTIVTGE